jgi:hypothetical protein
LTRARLGEALEAGLLDRGLGRQMLGSPPPGPLANALMRGGSPRVRRRRKPSAAEQAAEDRAARLAERAPALREAAP